MIRPIKILAALAVALTVGGYLGAEETKGTVKSVNTDRNEVVLKGVLRNTIYELNKDANICLDGVKCKLTDLKEDDKAAIVFEKQGEHMKASEVRGLRNAQETTGTIRNVTADKGEFTLKGLVKDVTYELNKDATVLLNGNRAALTDLREGDQAMITFQQKGDHQMTANVRATRK
jgi:Cu/Ag efflux protein CusF